MENNQNKNKIFVYLLVIFFAVFIGTSVFLVMNSKKTLSGNTMPTSVIVPTAKPVQGSMDIKLPENQGSSMTLDKELKIDLMADSNAKNIVGYDLVLTYDTSSFDFVSATSDLTDFKIYSYQKDGYISLLATKTLQSQMSSVFTQTKIASLVFKPLKAGNYVFSLKPIMGKDKTDLVTDKTEVLDPKLNELKIEVF